MSNDPVASGEGADDLLGRWLAHHDRAADDGVAESPAPDPARRAPE